MTSLEVILVMAGVSLAIIVLLGALTLRPHFALTRRYRPGQEWNYPPVLWTANPEALRGGSTNHRTTGGAREVRAARPSTTIVEAYRKLSLKK